MTYTHGGIIQRADYNSIVDAINPLFGIGSSNYGYGGRSINVTPYGNIPYLSASDIYIDNDKWLVLRNAIQNMAAHQGTTLPESIPPLSSLEDKDIIMSYDDRTPTNPSGELLSSANVTALWNNRLNVNPAYTTTTFRTKSARTAAWNRSIYHTFVVSFASEDEARFFFNTGGKISISASRSGGPATTQNDAWSYLLSQTSPFLFGANEYYALAVTPNWSFYRDVYVRPSPWSSYSGYGGNFWRIAANTNGQNLSGHQGKGYSIVITSQFFDNYTGASDIVDGTFESSVSEIKSTGIFNNISSPTITTVTNLSENPSGYALFYTIYITYNQVNLTLRNIATTTGWNGSSPAGLEFIVNGGVVLYSNSTGSSALYTGSFPGGTSVTLTNYGRIQGCGGNGGAGGYPGGGGAGGGPALQLQYPLVVNNYGQIWGGGGGGGGGSGCGSCKSTSGPSGGGGGSGTGAGSGGAAGGAKNHKSNCYSGNPGNPGSWNSGGAGGSGWDSGGECGWHAAGGNGGNPGQGGNSAGGGGGNAGYAITGAGYNALTVPVWGDIRYNVQ